MSEHLIRLRGGWERLDPRGGVEVRRVTLPLPRTDGVVRLARSFQTPRIDPARETLWLRIAGTPGLKVVILNGNVLGPVDDQSSRAYRLPIDLPARNRLVLDAEPAGPEWGEIALVIRGRDDPPPDAWREVGSSLE